MEFKEVGVKEFEKFMAERIGKGGRTSKYSPIFNKIREMKSGMILKVELDTPDKYFGCRAASV